jgi:alpha,alpha-trehalase
MSGAEPPARVFALGDYALLADGERGALVDPEGNIAWMCAPRWHDSALFCVLIGGRGSYSIAPLGRFVWSGRYEPRSLIWRSRWVTDQGVVECREALACPAAREHAILLRRVQVCAGSARMRVRLNPRADFDRHRARGLQRDEHDVWRAKSGQLQLRWWGAGDATPHEAGGLELELALKEGEHRDLTLLVGDGLPACVDAGRLWQGTAAHWRDRVRHGEGTIAPRETTLALSVLHGLTAQSGAIVAAATTSLPERSRHGRNYDYRYAWIRDGCYAGQAAARAGALELMDEHLRFVRERLLEHGGELSPAYSVDGEPVPHEATLSLSGYPGGSDVVGNRATDQFQLDPFGEIMLLIAAAAAHDRVQADDWVAAELAVAAAHESWTRPDAGLWEIDPQQWTHSRLCVAAGLRALERCAPAGASSAAWGALADEIVADCSKRALHRSGRWQRSPSDERVDASLLLAALRGAVPAEDPRSIATLQAVRAELAREHFVYRYRIDERALGEAEGAFLLCGFWASLACRQQGEEQEAIRFFERARSASGSPGLLAEEYDIPQRQLRGNLPQAFVHALLLETATELSS